MTLDFVFWDVQHGSAAYISTPNGTKIAVDLGTGSYGPSGSEFSPLLHLKQNCSIGKLDLVILTHPHRDHLDDILNYDSLKPRALILPRHLTEENILNGNRAEDKTIINAYLELMNRPWNTISPEADPTRSENNGGVKIRWFCSQGCPVDNLNNHSFVTVFSYAGLKLLIPGDNGLASWDELMKHDDFKSAIAGVDILVAPHHGRESGYSSALMDYMSPNLKLTIVSDGRFCDTSATSRYSAKSAGWLVHKRSGGGEERKCVTTRNDGHVNVKFVMNNGTQPFIEVTIS